ncbi:ABC transporter ATP-binding protein [Steroidobacter sp. S1-65]|uniref:ABC transporter ATP-binding protein n=1 Tax=Steroidobacter gossypii TaxID=2805490 RepID=A0ABS1WVF0_9GAMM|nr:ABC transporter ATP-binding protein [Steroidobacter gossypii]MBM0104946.1 ABC transporter ATP-binding protein [Steroidobacter gossypii]
MIELNDVRFSWSGGEPLLAIASLQVARGERVFMHGPSGSGKSTLLGLLGGVLEPQRGSVRIDGFELSAVKRSLRDRFRAEHIGFIFQMFNLIPYLSVLDNVALPARFSEQRRKRAADISGSLYDEARRLLAAVGLDPTVYADRQATQLSQGQQQRVAAARALFGRPQLIIADEPTSSLDADTRERFITLLSSECRASEATLIFVSHDASLRSQFDRQIALADINSAARLETAA